MADPRLTVSNLGARESSRTFSIDNSTIVYSATETNGSVSTGLAVTFSADDTVQLVGDGEAIVGKLISVTKDNFCTVQTHGVMTLPAGTGATLTLGEKIVGDLLSAAEGYIRVVATGTAAELGHMRGSIQNNAVTTAVVVEL